MSETFFSVLSGFCESREYKLREYSGRNRASNCIGIVVPNGSFNLIQFVYGLTKEISEIDSDIERENAFEYLEEFFSDLETDSFGRDSQILYNRNFLWLEFKTKG